MNDVSSTRHSIRSANDREGAGLHRAPRHVLDVRITDHPRALEGPPVRDRVLVADGAMGTMLHAANPTVDDYQGHEGLRKLFSDFEESWGDGMHVEPEAYFDLGEQTTSITAT